jgi:hypothetical protein
MKNLDPNEVQLMNQDDSVLHIMKYNYELLIGDIINKVIITLVLELYYHLLAIKR